METKTRRGWAVQAPRDYDSNKKFSDLMRYINTEMGCNYEGSHHNAWYGIKNNNGGEIAALSCHSDITKLSIDDAWEMIFGHGINNESTVQNLIQMQKPLI